MFTGLVEEVGRVVALRRKGNAGQLQLEAAQLSVEISVGDSVAVNGCCLTVAARDNRTLTFDLLGETLERTNLKNLEAGSMVNLERALAAGAPLGGHFVQGHVDCASPITAVAESGPDLRLEIELPREFSHYLAFKGSIAVNGISLTVAEISADTFSVWIIPHTRAQTNLATAKPNDLVNLEFDLLAKYVERMLERGAIRPS